MPNLRARCSCGASAGAGVLLLEAVRVVMVDISPQSDVVEYRARKQDWRLSRAVFMFVRDQTGSAAFEYALISCIVFVAIVGGLSAIGLQLETWLLAVSDAFSD